MSQRKNALGKQNKAAEIDYDSVLPLFKVLASLTGSIFLVSCVLVFIFVNDMEAKVVYTIILIINLIVSCGSAAAIKIIKKSRNETKK